MLALHGRLKEEASSESAELWVLGLEKSEEEQVYNSLQNCGGNIKSALPPSGPHEDHHWVVASSSACIDQLLVEHQTVTVVSVYFCLWNMLEYK